MNRNIPALGFLLGVLFPFIGMVIVYAVLFRDNSFNTFISYLLHDHSIAAKVLSLSILGNLIPFLYYTRKRLDYTARGVLVATMLFAVLILLLKFVW